MTLLKHGCAGGVSGFIYSSELFDFFQEHEEDIETFIDDAGLSPDAFLAARSDAPGERWTFPRVQRKSSVVLR